MGLDGYILFAFVLGFPANEIVVDNHNELYVQALLEFKSFDLYNLFGNGWTWLTAVHNVFPYALALRKLLNHRQGDQSLKWTNFAVPTVAGIVCMLTAGIVRLTGLVYVIESEGDIPLLSGG